MTENLDLNSKNTNENIGWITSILVHALLLLLVFLFPAFSYLDPPPEIQGILVTLGDPDIEETDEKESSASTNEVENEEKIVPIKPQKKIEEKKTKVETPKKQVEKAIVETQNASDITAAKRAQEAKLEEVRIVQENREKKQKEEAYNKAKSKYGKMFGSGKADKDKKTKGTADGKPNAKVLEGVTKGSGRIGGGLKDRGLEFVPKFKDDSQKEGRVVVKVCVDSSGKVISTNYTQRGSTTTDSELIAIAIRNAKKYVFSSLEIEEQCGSVTVDFKLR